MLRKLGKLNVSSKRFNKHTQLRAYTPDAGSQLRGDFIFLQEGDPLYYIMSIEF